MSSASSAAAPKVKTHRRMLSKLAFWKRKKKPKASPPSKGPSDVYEAEARPAIEKQRGAQDVYANARGHQRLDAPHFAVHIPGQDFVREARVMIPGPDVQAPGPEFDVTYGESTVRWQPIITIGPPRVTWYEPTIKERGDGKVRVIFEEPKFIYDFVNKRGRKKSDSSSSTGLDGKGAKEPASYSTDSSSSAGSEAPAKEPAPTKGPGPAKGGSVSSSVEAAAKAPAKEPAKEPEAEPKAPSNPYAEPDSDDEAPDHPLHFGRTPGMARPGVVSGAMVLSNRPAPMIPNRFTNRYRDKPA